MPKETSAKVAEILESQPDPKPSPQPAQPVTPESITGLEEADHRPTVHGTVAEILAARKKAKTEEPKEQTDEEKAKEKQLDEVDAKLKEMLFKGKPKSKRKEVEEEEPEPKEEAVVAAPPAPEPEPKPAPAKAPKKTRDRAAELREQELELEKQRIALEKERLELEKARSKPAEPKQDSFAEELSEEDRYNLEVFQEMGKEFADRFISTAKATAKYKAQWEKDHPGEVFDADDSDHDAFFASNVMKYDKKDFKRAEMRLASKGVEDPKIKELEQTNLELKASNKLRELEPVAMRTWAKYADAMVEAIDPEIVKVTRKAGAKAGEALLQEFPEEGKDIIKAAEELAVLSQEAFKILEGDGLFAPDERSNQVHAKILNIIRRQEQIIPRQPREDRLDADGRDFATWEQWLNMSPQQQANYWHLGAEQIVDIESRYLAGRVKYEIDRAMKIAESRQKRSKPPEPESVVKEKPSERKSPSASPGGASKATVDTPAKTPDPVEDRFVKSIRSKLFPRAS